MKITDEMVELGARAAHNRACLDECGLASSHERDITRAALEAVGPAIVAAALRDAADALDDDAWGMEDEYQDGVERSSAYLRELSAASWARAPHV